MIILRLSDCSLEAEHHFASENTSLHSGEILRNKNY